MLIYTTTYNNLKVEFYANNVPDRISKNTIRIRVDTSIHSVQCHANCLNCPLDAVRTATYIGSNCAERGIDYFQKVTKDQFPEWSI